MAFLQRSCWSWSRAIAGSWIAAIAAVVAAGCVSGPAVLTHQVEARRLASELHLQFTKAADAANRAVMADTDEASAAAAREAEQATLAVQQNVEQLEPILRSLAYTVEIQFLDAFNVRFTEYQKLDHEILPLAVENTNLKAQRLSFTSAREAADAFQASLEAAAHSVTSKSTCCVEALVAKARAAVLEIQVLEARHIPESDEAAMSRIEAHMAESDAAARKALDSLRGLLPSTAAAQFAAATAALDRFKGVNAEIVTLSRRNSNVRSLALSLGRKRTIAAECDDALRALEEALAKHEFTATR